MKCTHNDCFTCPYPDCIAGAKTVPNKSVVKKDKAKIYKSEYDRQRYQKNKDKILAKYRKRRDEEKRNATTI
jgi:hypothetical protein